MKVISGVLPRATDMSEQCAMSHVAICSGEVQQCMSNLCMFITAQLQFITICTQAQSYFRHWFYGLTHTRYLQSAH